ncbi:hypothetical protein E2C01_055518 [Portunus trituberculatus]|uniref:Uncharacterized protein n=1 Tax=Portunus trituberculatus TaxID=210409 RepID=A0A5B7GV02_PORTR|nr:hypothetical protein [Portunus trituberculatus]
MDPPSSGVTNVANPGRSSRRDSVGNGAMANGVAGSSCDSEDAEEVEGGGGGGGVRAGVNVLAGVGSVGSVGSLNVASADPNNKEDSAAASTDDADQAKELEELAKLRCQSVATEVVAERYKRRCSDYPGFAFGSSIFSSNTLMKFSIIKNELHNIMNVQLKRVSIYTVMPASGEALLCTSHFTFDIAAHLHHLHHLTIKEVTRHVQKRVTSAHPPPVTHLPTYPRLTQLYI